VYHTRYDHLRRMQPPQARHTMPAHEVVLSHETLLTRNAELLDVTLASSNSRPFLYIHAALFCRSASRSGCCQTASSELRRGKLGSHLCGVGSKVGSCSLQVRRLNPQVGLCGHGGAELGQGVLQG
jgi:hypothetical protein